MSFPRPIPAPAAPLADWVVRVAEQRDAACVAGAVRRLLLELGATPAPLVRLTSTARAIIADPDAGIVLLAEDGDEVIGVLAASLQEAIHVAGRYAIVQDLWVATARRGQTIGAALIEAFVESASRSGVQVIEVGLPRANFGDLEATEEFYLVNGFEPVGARMRRRLL